MNIKFVWQILVPSPPLEIVIFHWLEGRNIWKRKQQTVTSSLLRVHLWHHKPVHKTARIHITNVIRTLNSGRLSCCCKRLTGTFGIQASVIFTDQNSRSLGRDAMQFCRNVSSDQTTYMVLERSMIGGNLHIQRRYNFQIPHTSSTLSH